MSVVFMVSVINRHFLGIEISGTKTRINDSTSRP